MHKTSIVSGGRTSAILFANLNSTNDWFSIASDFPSFSNLRLTLRRRGVGVVTVKRGRKEEEVERRRPLRYQIEILSLPSLSSECPLGTLGKEAAAAATTHEFFKPSQAYSTVLLVHP